ncbi:MAG: hypothetical protein K2H36_02050, partial [Clostridia bacterium]|nr:hypothetical protein [Clostridia bacterium]
MKEKKQKQATDQVAVDAQPKKSKLKAFLQFILFIVLSMAGFIVQLLIKLFCVKIPFIKDLDADVSKNFNLFGIGWLEQTLGTFIVVMVGILLCKLINFILHRKVLFKPRHNLAFGIVMYIIFSILLWMATTIVDQPLTNAFVNASWWTQGLFKGNEAAAKDVGGTLAMIIYSCADLIIMFFAEKFLIMNDKLFSKNKKEEVVAEGENAVAENAIAESAVASDVVEEKAETVVEEVAAEKVEETVEAVEEKTAEPVAAEEITEEAVEEPATEEVVEEIIEEVVEEVVEDAPVETEEIVEEVVEEVVEEQPATEEIVEEVVEEVVETADATVAVEEVAAEEVEKEEAVVEEQVAAVVEEPAPAKKTATKKTAASAKSGVAAKKTTTTKATAAKATPAKKTTTAKASATTAKKTTATKATAAKA